MRPVPYPIQASRLDTQFLSDPECTHHVKFVSDNALNQRRIRKEEKWSRKQELGRGTYGIVWLERCIQGDDKGSLRAVKKVQKPESGDYYGELEAVSLFSHAKYEHCFVKSLGWYDDEFSIFIAMEYLPDGDLQKYLHSPLLEEEARHIILQVLEGLQFMHDNGFTHRDLKPANILVKCKGPDWWVKIADFGISKHVIEEQTALRTSVGTPSFAAPEVLGFFRPGDRPKDSYTSAVDVWSLGVIAFLVLSAQTPFKDPRLLNQYVMGDLQFPLNVLLSNKVSTRGCDFVKQLMAPNSEDRPKVKGCLQHPWFKETVEIQREFNISNLSSWHYFEPEPSANWSTQDQISTQEPDKLSDVLWREASPVPSMTATSSITTSSSKLAPSKSPEHIHPTPLLEQSTQDHISNHEPHRIGMLAQKAKPSSRNIVTPSVLTYTNIPISSTTSDEAVESPMSTSRKIVALPTHESAAHIDWQYLRSLRGFLVTFSTDGKLIATVLDNETIRLWDSSTGNKRENLKGHLHGIKALKFSPDGTLLASASRDHTVKLWDLATMTLRATLQGHSAAVCDAAFSPDGTLLASASWDNTVKLWDLATMTLRATLQGNSAAVCDPAFSPDVTLLASASRDNTVKLWDLATVTQRATLVGHQGTVFAVTFSMDGKLLASASWDKTVKLWDPVTGMIRHTLNNHCHLVGSVVFSPDGTMLAYASEDKSVKLWDLATMTIRHTLQGHPDYVVAVTFSPNGTLLASGSWDKHIRLWDPTTGILLQSLKTSWAGINSVAFSPNGNTIVAADWNGKVTLWRLLTNEETKLIRKENTISRVFRRLLN